VWGHVHAFVSGIGEQEAGQYEVVLKQRDRGGMLLMFGHCDIPKENFPSLRRLLF
jgi:hypothetical protein